MCALTDQDVDEIEKALGLLLPGDVRAQYRVSNGMKGPTNCQLLYTYKLDDNTDVVRVNLIRDEEWFPMALRSTVFVGDDGCGNLVGYDWKKKQAILWNPEDGEWIQEQRETVTEIWAYIRRFYENAA